MRPPSVLLLALVLAATARTALAAPEKPPSKAPVVFVDTLKKADLFDTLTYPARLVPQRSAILLAEADGIVKEIQLPLGRAVRKNVPVMTIVNTDPVYQYAPMVVRSPVEGVVSSVDVTEGSRVNRGQKLATVTDPKLIKITLEVPAADLSALSQGLEGSLTIPSSEQSVPVVISGISPFVDPATGTAPVELKPKSVGKSALQLPPGLVGRVSFKVREHEGLQVPDQAIVYRGQQPGIRMVIDGKSKFQAITLGATRRGLVEVTKGVPVGARVIVRASSFVGDGEAVTIEKDEKDAEPAS